MPFTDNPSQPPTVVFPNPGMQSLSSVIHLLGVSVLGYCFARRTTFPDLSWNQIWSTITWPRLCVILVLADSWVFVFLSGVLVLGTGLSKDNISCSLGIYACIALYVLSKILTYIFLIEKVHVVWGGAHQPRLKSPVYRICLITVTPYAVVLVLMLIGRIAYLRDDGACVIGLKRLASLTLLVYDLYINIFLTGLFIWPLARSKLINPRLKSVAIRTLVAAGAALTTSTLNIAILTIMDGRQLGWVCLGSCGTDVTVNAVVLFWVTAPTSNNMVSHSGPHPTANGPVNEASMLASAHARGLASPGPGRRGSTALVMSNAPRSPVTASTPNLQEKTFDPTFLSPSAWKTKFSVSLGSLNKTNGQTARLQEHDQEMEMSPSPRSSPRREVWDERGASFAMMGDLEANSSCSSPGYVTIGAPPPSKKRNVGRSRSINSPQQSGSRSSIFGRIFNSSDAGDRDMEVTVTITTQLDGEEYMPSPDPRRSIGETSTAGGSAITKLEGVDGSTTLESLHPVQLQP